MTSLTLTDEPPERYWDALVPLDPTGDDVPGSGDQEPEVIGEGAGRQ
jgi:hypothetical protein